MNRANRLTLLSSASLILALAVFLLTGCETTTTTSGPAAPAVVAAPVVPPAPAAPAVAAPPVTPAPAMAPVTASGTMPIRIKAGLATSLTNSDGTVWLADQGFTDGEMAEHADGQITNTPTPAIYKSERYSMTAFSYPVPNGKYIVRLHFAETYEGVTAAGQRVFSFNVEGKEFKDFDVWAKAGGPFLAYVETVNVEVTDGKLDITFTANVQNPEINGIEIIPAP
jgi:Malectin domain